MKSDFENYYYKFQWITRKPNWRQYLHTNYETGIAALNNGAFKADLNKQGFTALLSGTSGEVTSYFFVEYLLGKNPDAKIVILDIGTKQIEESRKLLSEKFPDANITYLQEDIRKCSLKDESIDYIDTDALLQFFPYKEVKNILLKWNKILKPGGFITTRILARKYFYEIFFDYLTSILGGILFGVKFYHHKYEKVINIMEDTGFIHYYAGGTFYRTLRKVSLVKI